MSGMAGMDHGMPMASATAGAPDHSGHAMPGTTMTGDAPKPGSPAMAGMGMTAGPPVSGLRKALVNMLTLLMLLGGYALAARYGDLSMQPGRAMAPMPGMPM